VKLSRREFVGHLSAAGVVSLCGVSLAGCNLENEILDWIPAGEAAVNSILGVLNANGIVVPATVQLVVQTIEAGFTALTTAIKNYQAVTPPPVGAIAAIEAALSSVTSAFNQFVSGLSPVAGKILTLVVDLGDVVLSTIAGFENSLGTGTVKVSLTNSRGTAVAAQKRTKRQFRHDWNAKLSAAITLGAVVPKSAYL
jgi:hypothetical protein